MGKLLEVGANVRLTAAPPGLGSTGDKHINTEGTIMEVDIDPGAEMTYRVDGPGIKGAIGFWCTASGVEAI